MSALGPQREWSMLLAAARRPKGIFLQCNACVSSCTTILNSAGAGGHSPCGCICMHARCMTTAAGPAHKELAAQTWRTSPGLSLAPLSTAGRPRAGLYKRYPGQQRPGGAEPRLLPPPALLILVRSPGLAGICSGDRRARAKVGAGGGSGEACLPACRHVRPCKSRHVAMSRGCQPRRPSAHARVPRQPPRSLTKQYAPAGTAGGHPCAQLLGQGCAAVHTCHAPARQPRAAQHQAAQGVAALQGLASIASGVGPYIQLLQELQLPAVGAGVG